MELNALEEVIKELNTISKQEKIEIFRIGSSLPSEIPTIQLDEDENKGIAETDTDAILEIRNFMRLAKSLEIKAVFYKLDQIDNASGRGYDLELYLLHNGINFTSKIRSSNYLEILKISEYYEAKEIQEKLNKVRDGLKNILLKENFNEFQFVDNSFLPFLDRSQIDYHNEYFKVNDIVKTWFAEISGIENISALVDELVDYYVDKEVDYESKAHGLKFLGQLISLEPYLSDTELYNIRSAIDSIAFRIYHKTVRA